MPRLGVSDEVQARVPAKVRQMSLLSVLSASRQPLSMGEIFGRLSGFYLPVGQDWQDQDQQVRERVRRMFNRDLSLLRSLGYRITYVSDDGDDGDGGYRLENLPVSRGQRISREDQETLRLLAGIGPLIRESPLDDALRMALARIEALAEHIPATPSNDAVIFSHREFRRPTLTPAVPGEYLTTVWTALREQRPVTMVYQSAHAATPRKRRVDPWGLFQKAGIWYLVGWCHDRKALRMFVMHRVKSLELEDGSLEVPRPQDFSIEQWASSEPWEIPIHDPVEVTLELDAEVAGLRHGPLRRATATSLGPNGPWRLRVQANNVEPLIGLVLGQWGHARVLDPPEVRQRLESIVDHLLALHAEEDE